MNNSYTYTKASRFLALFVFLIVIPVLAFTVGVQYEKTSQVLSGNDIISASVPQTATGTMMHTESGATVPVTVMTTTTSSTTTVTTASSTAAASSTNPRPNDKVLVR